MLDLSTCAPQMTDEDIVAEVLGQGNEDDKELDIESEVEFEAPSRPSAEELHSAFEILNRFTLFMDFYGLG